MVNPQGVYRHDTIVDHNDTIVDGELVIDQEPDGTLVTRYLAFDLLAYNGNNIIAKPLTSRLGVSNTVSSFALIKGIVVY